MADPQAQGRADLAQAIARSGLSARHYAERVLTRDERTVRRWQSGKSPIPREVLRFLAAGARMPRDPEDIRLLNLARELLIGARWTDPNKAAAAVALEGELKQFLEPEPPFPVSPIAGAS